MGKTFTVKVIPRSLRNEVVERSGELVVYVTATPVDGKANEAVLKLLSKHVGVARSRLMIVRGKTSGQKLVQVV
jgi:hypothetical protein